MQVAANDHSRGSGRFGGERSARQRDRDAGAAEVDEGDEGCGGVEAEAAVADQADAAVEALEAAVGEPEADGGEDAGAVATDRARELDERDQPRPRRPGEPAIQVRRCEPR